MSEEPNAVPHRRNCGTMEVHQRLLEALPGFRQRLADLEHATQLRRMLVGGERSAEIVRMPVVVHIVWNSPSENIADVQVQSQVDALNRDYRANNADKTQVPKVWGGLVADTGIEFQLATVDPDGKPTNGITRTPTSKNGFSTDDSVKSAATGGADPWPSSKYLNLWVCTLTGGLLGYAQFPGGADKTDGVVILNTAFGTTGSAQAPFNLGRTAVHEIGHWLNLHHIWGDTSDCSGSDFVEDTPPQQNPNYGRPSFPHISCDNGPSGDMFCNYMDYVDDAAMVMFTPGQSLRMHAALNSARATFVGV